MTRLSCLGVNPLLKIHSIFYICKRKYSTFSLKKKFTKTKKIKDIHNPNAREKKIKSNPHLVAEAGEGKKIFPSSLSL
jgi:hypothetical protein